MSILRLSLICLTLILAFQTGYGEPAEEASSESQPTVKAKLAGRSNRSKERLKESVYPPDNLIVSRNSSLYLRLTEPRIGFKPVKGWMFRVAGGVQGLEVTPNWGIVYVGNPKELQSHEPHADLLKIEIYNGANKSESFSHQLAVELVDDKSDCGYLEENDTHCSRYASEGKCKRSCGVASNAFCLWRAPLSNNPSRLSHDYATCTPNTSHCPNMKCDELEEKDYRICPQDCTTHVFGSGLPNGEKGISAASGVCICNELFKCTCSNEKSSADPLRSPNKNGGSKRDSQDPNSSSRCDSTCMVFLSGCVALLLVVLLATTVYIKRLIHFARIILSRREALLEPKETSLFEWGAAQASEAAAAGSSRDDQETKLYCVPNLKYLPLDPKWEFPRERLNIEKVLGEGEFGQVLQASAIDLPGVPGRTTVAVKALKAGAGNTELNDLLTEYELLKEVSHPNIIRLLGACTCSDGQIFIIIEYADKGSLRGYLRGCRRGGRQALERERLSLKTLISYAWQISKGMEYLSEMKMVHRDLAARNILLTSKGVCKVSDFGLSRDVYEDDTYLKQSRGKVPVKWMALESLSDQVYTSKSDVWSYGVLIWELLTLGLAPYPGIAIQNLYDLLLSGYRMENPVPNSQCKLYHLMQACWATYPTDRPSFMQITSILNRILQEGSDYLDITSDIVMNQEYMHVHTPSLDIEC
ncbi:proto-oncogene tyrosine-protein kinase receptor Ret isoform X1 [Cloeon dipterum]|uniref:proto-oncogene tyrosine-protein kinase receptor Ret isoform X1 n=1 Tax=Cloeon dipterum TaxID=197152 RepID=UPI0032207D12